jgi:ribonucleoside-diphosphate reductase alpha chain
MMKNQIPKIETPEFKLQRIYTKAGVHPFDMVMWEKRDSVIMNAQGKKVFEQKDVEVPSFWSQTATNIAASKYFRGKLGTPERETSVKQMINRVVTTIVEHGKKEGYFANLEEASIFQDELTYILLNQIAAFNSPVWFNFGVEKKPQGSACQPYHAMVSTPNGLIPIGEIVTNKMIGLPVYDKDGITIVTNVKENGVKKVYRIHLSNGTYVEATADHLVLASETRRTKGKWMEVGQLRAGMKMHLHPHKGVVVDEPITKILTKRLLDMLVIDNKNQQIYETDVTPDEAALAGWLQGDGFVGQYQNNTNRSLIIEFQTANDFEFNYVMNKISNIFKGCHYHVIEVPMENQKLRYRKIRLHGEKLRWFVDKYELEKRGIEMHAPAKIFTAGRTAIIEYLRSLFQADGYIALHGKNSAHIAFAVISKELARDVQRLLFSLGIYSRVRQKKEKRPDRYDMWEVDVSISSEREKFAKLIGFVDERKQEKLLESLKRTGKKCPDVRWETIVEIEDIGEQPVYDIQTLSGNYLSENVVVHNCFINSVEDDMRSILQLAVTEGMLFKYGSGAGVNLSVLRSSKEYLSSGGKASGPVSFMKGYDAFAGVIKSGGKTRRAAKMVILNVDHPDIREFIWCKAKEERKAKDLIRLGYDGSLDGDVYSNIFFQNANNSVRVTDEFMRAVKDGKTYKTRYVSTGKECEELDARSIMKEISEATWECGDPGIQFDTTINKWHTCKASGRINASNPCSEFLFIDNSACNLASINLLKFLDPETGRYDVEKFKHTVAIMIIAQEIIVGLSSYPTPEIEKNSHDFRPLGLGYANLGALLMAAGLPYDSDEGRNFAAAISSVMTGYGYYVSAWLAKKMGAFKYYSLNKDSMLEVIRMHLEAAERIGENGVPNYLLKAAREVWQHAFASGSIYGYRNAQISALAPTGTIGFLMDCDTTGIEPDMALIKYKWLVGGGMMKIVNSTIPIALKKLGYSEQQISDILHYIDENETIEGAPHLKEDHLPVFDCAFKPAKGKRFISYMGHIKMMAAVQPFISGAISKTVNMPKESTVEDIYNAYVTSWELGLKAIAIYRDGSKGVQPVTITKEVKEVDSISAAKVEVKEVVKEVVREVVVNKPFRRKLPDERKSITHKFSISGHEGYITVGLYEDGQPGEIFITMSKEGSSISGLMDAFATSISIALQYGVPLKTLVKKFVHMRFEPSGYTSHPNIRYAKSLMDYIFRWMALKFLSKEDQIEVGLNFEYEETITNYLSQGEEKEDKIETSTVKAGSGLIDPSGPVGSPPGNVNERKETAPVELAVQNKESREKKNSKIAFENSEDAPACAFCGAIMVRNGSCYKCLNCGATSGCS